MTGWAEMERLLEEERALLLAGRIADLPGLAERKLSVLSGLGGGGGPPDRVREMAVNNAGLLEAAGRGIRTALRQIEEARGARETKTYDAHGRINRLGGAGTARGTRV